MIKSGWEQILIENEEVRVKHGFSLQRDAEFYLNGELIQAALFAEEQANIEKVEDEKCPWPEDWNRAFEIKIRQKTKKGKLVVAGSFYLSEFHRTGEKIYMKKAKAIGRKIDKIHL